MGKIKIGLIILGSIALVGLVLAGVVTASNGNGKEMARVMADTTGIIDKVIFKIRGCEIVHELSDVTALKCPTNIISKLKVREDPLLYIMDMEANIQINADDVWALGYTGTGVTVAVLDTGIDTDHPELADSIAGGKGFGYATYEDDHGHGTHVSGIITANGVNANAKGVAPDTSVWMAKVCNASGSCYTSDIAAAIEYIVNNNIAKIMSISLGGGGTSRANCDTDYLAKKVNWAVDNGVTVAAAAGNTSGRVSSPGCASKAIAVGAVNKSDVRASWSGSGSALDIMAPGVNIYSTIIDGYDSWSGTSMATPHISATVALLRQANSALTDSQIKDALYKTAKDLGATGWDKYYGWGRVDALAALNWILPDTTPPIISNVITTNITSISATVTWTTNEPSNSVVNYGKTTLLGSTISDAAMVTSHSVNLTGLEKNTVYYYEVQSTDASGNTATDNNNGAYYTFTTLENQPPIANAGPDKSAYVGDTVNFDCSSSCDPDGTIVSYNWDFGDGTTGSGVTVSHIYSTIGDYIVTLIVADNDGATSTDTALVNISEKPAQVLCWSKTNLYLYRAADQARKFCKCAQGSYGYNSYKYNRSLKTVYKYVDTTDNIKWDVTSLSSYRPIYSVTCTDGKAYPTNLDYSYPK